MIVREDRNEVAVLRIEHGKVNALDLELLGALHEAARELSSARPRGVVLTGTGRTFSAGLDLVRLLAEDESYARRLLPALHEALLALYTLPRPVIAAVNGHAIAGGFVIACTCDYRVVADGGAKLGITELPVGVPFPAGPLEVVRDVLGTRAARELMYGGGLVSVQDGSALGFANELADPDQVVERAVEIASAWGGTPAAAFELTKRQLQEPVVERLAESAGTIDRQVAEAWTDPAIRAAIRSFLESTLGK